MTKLKLAHKIKKLFNFSFIDNNFNIKSNTDINLLLKNYKLFSFHHRLTLRLLLFIHRIMFGRNPPIILKQQIQLNDINTRYNLRSNNKFNFILERNNTKYGEITFKNFYSKYLNIVNFMDFDRNFQKFKHDRLSNNVLYDDLFKLLKTFPKFNCDIDFLFSSLINSFIKFIFFLSIYLLKLYLFFFFSFTTIFFCLLVIIISYMFNIYDLN